jgi:hypothetical protein
LGFMKSPLLLFLVVFQIAAIRANGEPSAQGCRWSGPTADWVLSRRLPATEISGLVGSVVVLSFVQSHGLPVSFISRATGDTSVRLKISSGTTLRELLEETIQQAPGYRYGIFNDKIVVYPAGEAYDTPVSVATQLGVRRGMAIHDLLHALKGQTAALQNLDMHIMRGMGKATIYGDVVDIGGTHSIVEHLVSLIQKRPSATFQMILTPKRHLYYDFYRVPLVENLAVVAPSRVQVGETFASISKGTLSDGTAVLLEGPECYVKYVVTGDGVLTIDDLGRVVAQKKGSATIVAEYEDKFAQANVQVW